MCGGDDLGPAVGRDLGAGDGHARGERELPRAVGAFAERPVVRGEDLGPGFQRVEPSDDVVHHVSFLMRL